jgi:tRNA (guanine-N7-)-methyltransferase
MKPCNLKSPFTWESRQIVIEDRVWYVPPQADNIGQFCFPGWNDTNLFSNEQPISIEFCSGNGLWIAEKAKRHQDQNWVGVERKFERVRKIWSKIKNLELPNLLAICGEGYFITKHFFLSESISNVYINFPDPWPKTRHAKHRIVQTPFLFEILRILKPGGVITLVTDDELYSKQMIDLNLQVTGFKSLYAAPYYTLELPNYGNSYFEDLWREKGKKIFYHQFQKQ